MRVLITGAEGMLGHDLSRAVRGGEHEVVELDRTQLDVTEGARTREVIAEARPDVVINCAAWTDVDGAEASEAEATAVNGDGAGNVAAAAYGAGAFVVQVSTDYVFDGRADSPYSERAETNPLSAYGRSKLAGEHAVRKAAPEAHAIVRTSWLFGVAGPNFVATMLRLGAERHEVTVVSDQIGRPTYTGHLAAALVAIAEQRPIGVLHVAGEGSCSWFDLAVATFERAGVDCAVRPGSTAELGRPAPRPLYSVLGLTRPETPALAPWQEGLDEYLVARVGAAEVERT
ncbi:MAG: dTDP-4-dehydrorhamnose reductase [Actinomycetota bacterium]|nr:dTDP-4-dehydrorhamnose reductase [Actinomycetota bacterium]